MPYDESIADRVRDILSSHTDTKNRVTEKRTIGGGLLFMLNGHMCCSVRTASLMVRVGPPSYRQALKLPHTTPLEFGGKSPLGYVCVDPAGFKTGKALQTWLQRGIYFVTSLPPKKAPVKKASAKKPA